MGSHYITVRWRLTFLFPQAGQALITLFYQLYPTRTSTATRNHIQASSPTWKRDVRRGITATSMVARRLFCVPTAPSSPRPYLFATGGSTSDATSARLYTSSTAACTARLKKTLHDHTDLSPKNFYKIYLYERAFYKCWQYMRSFRQVQKRLFRKFYFEENWICGLLSRKRRKTEFPSAKMVKRVHPVVLAHKNWPHGIRKISYVSASRHQTFMSGNGKWTQAQ